MAEAAPIQHPSRRGTQFALAMAAPLGWLIVWSIGVKVTGVQSDLLPPPGDVLRQLIQLAMGKDTIGEGTLWVHVAWSALRFLAGLSCALVVGVALGLVLGYFRGIALWVLPGFNAIRSVPPIAWAPFALLWFGASFGSQVFVIFVASLPPVLLNTLYGLRSVDPALVKAARMLGARPGVLLRRVILRAAMPHVLAGARIAVVNGWLALVGAEIVAGPGALTGLGFLVLVGQQNLQAALSVGTMIVIGMLGALINSSVTWLERRLAAG
jgi:ABC-type nitrate/sulfonate/bicarbonate transport system permease component